MQFTEGQIVVHPHHGPADVTGIVTRQIRGVPVEYINLTIQSTSLAISVPMEKADEVGLREVFDAEQVERLLAVLQAPTGHEEQAWSRRFKENNEKLSTGDLFVIAGVVRDLTRRLEDKGLSAGEKDMLKTARKPLLAELALATGVSEEEAERMLDGAIEGQAAAVATPALAS